MVLSSRYNSGYSKPPSKRKYSKRVSYKRSSKKYLKPYKTFKKAVKKIIHGEVETKQAWLTYPLASFNSAADTSSDILNALPFVQQGTQEYQRIGDDIRAQKLIIKGHMISTLSGSVPYTRIGVRMVCCQPKLTTSNTLVNSSAAQWLPFILRNGATNIGLNGTIESLYAPIDTDVVTCWYDKVFYINQPQFLTAVGAAEVVNSTKFFQMTLNLKNKLLKYNSNYSAGNFPINYSPSILFSYVFLDGTAPTTISTPMSMTFTAELLYEDA